MFINEDDPFRPCQKDFSFKSNTINQSSTFHSHNRSAQYLNLNCEASFSDFTQNILKYLYKSVYPINQALFNPICALCTKFVHSSQSFTVCDIRNSWKYVIHDNCLIKNVAFQMNIITVEEDEMQFYKCQQQNQVNKLGKNIKSLNLQYKEFFIQIIFYHPISEKKFGKIQKRQKINVDDIQFQVIFDNSTAEDSFFSPNMLILPLTDYQVEFGIYQIGNQNKLKIKKYINFKKLPFQDDKSLSFGNQQINFLVDIYHTELQKKTNIDLANYKYKYAIESMSIIRIHKVTIQIPEQLKQQNQDNIYETSSSKMLEFLEIDKIDNNQDSQTITNNKSNLSFNSFKSKKARQHIDKDSPDNSESGDREKVNLQKLIKSNTLKDYVRNNTQSRSFQNFLATANKQDIEKVLMHMKPQFASLMKHEYGNYMMQRLFSVCNLQKRLEIIQALLPQLNQIVMNKQGTHAFQQFLSFFTTQDEQALVLCKIRENFFQLCIHNNGTHFIQKIVKIFPINLLNQFFYYCVQNLYQFSCDKNGMCVVKYMMKRLKQICETIENDKNKQSNIQKIIFRRQSNIQNNILARQDNFLTRQNNISTGQNNILAEQNNILTQQDNILIQQGNVQDKTCTQYTSTYQYTQKLQYFYSQQYTEDNYRKDQLLKVAQQYKKLFVQATLFNLDAIIGDMYGNYVVQFNFQLFQPYYTAIISESLLYKLPQYSLSKYSTNVIYKCLSAYWLGQYDYVSSVLKEVLQPFFVLEMYANKDGNKVLLEIIQKYEGFEIWDKLYSILITTQPTRYYHDRWGACLGSRSGTVGGNWASFSDAMQKNNLKALNIFDRKKAPTGNYFALKNLFN